jgi:uncharacterized protein YqfB (UPF0267 family)
MEQRRHLFLDLEDTIITPVVEGWPNVHLINVPKIKRVIQEFQPHSLHLFSFAIWNEFEKDRFMDFVQPRIENVLGMKLGLIPMVDVEIKQACCEIMCLSPDSVDFNDMSEFWSKQESFRLYSRFVFRNNWKNWQQATEVMFLDDAVEDEDFFFPQLKLKGCIRNIDKMEG